MSSNEVRAYHAIAQTAENLASERARWAAVLARPTNRPLRKPAKPAGLLARIAALFA